MGFVGRVAAAPASGALRRLTPSASLPPAQLLLRAAPTAVHPVRDYAAQTSPSPKAGAATGRIQPHSRLLHSCQQLKIDDKNKSEHFKIETNDSTDEPNIEVENFPHFREAKKAKETQKGSSLAEAEEHPDVEEGRAMQDGGYRLPHPIWHKQELESVRISHRPPVGKVDKLAYYSVQLLRTGFDVFSGYTLGTYTGRLDEKQWVKRIIFLETIAGVPGMVGAMVRHLVSLRRLKRDHGWIHTLLEEAENARMALMTAMRIANPGIIMRTSIVVAQGIFVSGFSLAYLISPRFCHRFVGYLEEEAVKTYTHCLEELDSGNLKMWCRMKAPEIAVEYWKLPDDAMMRDVILAIRADAAHARSVNHDLGSRKPDEQNPYPPGQ
nr:cmRNA-ATP5F1B-mutAOX [synthetic construct]QOZ05780.1 cmRNA-HBA1-mutAOX [synthetic construct]QOZ05782.1 cmRNA-minimal-mutAOX [synthetic construct]